MAPTAHEAIVNTAFAMGNLIDVDGYGDRGAPLIGKLLCEVHHLIFSPELSGRGVLPPHLRALPLSEGVGNAPAGDHHGVGRPGSECRLLFAIGHEAVFATSHGHVSGLVEFLAEEGNRCVDLTDIVIQKMGADDEVIESAAAITKGDFIVGAFVEVVPSKGINLFLGEGGKVKHVR